MPYGGMTPYPRRYGGKGPGLRLEATLNSLNLARGTAYDTTQSSVVYAENMAIARALNAGWATNARLGAAFDPQRLTGTMIPRWEKIMAIVPSPTDDDATRRARLVANWQRWGQNFNTSLLVNTVTTLLGSTLVAVQFTDVAGATSYWPAGQLNATNNMWPWPERLDVLSGSPSWTMTGGPAPTLYTTSTPSLGGPSSYGWQLTEDGTTGVHGPVGAPTVNPIASTQPYVLSAFVHALGRDMMSLSPRFGGGFADGVDAIFDLTAAAVTGTANIGAGVAGRTSIENYGNSWFRCAVAVTGVTTQFAAYVLPYSRSAAAYSYAGTNGLATIAVNGVMLERGTMPSTYPTVWQSTVFHLRFKVSQPAGMTDGDFYSIVNSANRFLDGQAPAHVTWDWWRVDSVNGVQGFYLDASRNLGGDAFDV